MKPTPTGKSPHRRRFIAGAVCPRCSEMDRIVVDLDTDERECVACGFRDKRPVAAPKEVKTRVNRASARRVETSAEPVRLMDADSSAASDSDG
ncbi:MAG: YheV family putative metal-binding protein [Pseudomonadota bacterium]